MKTRAMTSSTGTVIILFLLSLGAPANAASVSCDTEGVLDVVCEATKTVVGDDLSIFRFSIERSSQYQLDLADFNWPSESIAEFSLVLSTATTALGNLSSTGALTFFAAPGTYFVQVYARASATSKVGLYGVTVTDLTPVPIPAPLFLLLSSLLALGIASRRRDTEADPASLPSVA